MGAIYLGKKLGSGGFEKEVVLKQLLPEYTARPEFRDLFFREARISATLDHANIVHTFDLVESDQSLFIVMEYVRGADLRTIVRRARQRRRDLSPAAAVHIALGILTGLSYAHTRRDAAGNSLDIIHRDVSPSNIICSVQGEAKLSDFGIARASTHSSVFYRVRGKVGYMSPEQARNLPIDHRCDLFSLGVCLYESLSGERLFVGDLTTPAEAIYGHAILPLSQKRPGIPAALDAVLARALAPELTDRYATAAEFSDALRTVAHHSGLAFSAPELADHLQDILGSDAARWLRDEPVVELAGSDPSKIPPGSVGLVGKEAASIGIVNETRDDDALLAMLSPKTVSGGKDFDLDSMLNDEAPPAGRPRPKVAPADAEVTTTWEPRRESAGPKVDGDPSTDATRPRAPMPAPPPPGLKPGESLSDRLAAKPPASRRAPPPAPQTPPPVWTRDSGPLLTSGSPAPRPLPVGPVPPVPSRTPLAVPAPPAELPARKTGARTMRGPSVIPPPFIPISPISPISPVSPGSPSIPVLPVASQSPPPPPPMPPAPAGILGRREEQTSEFEEPTPGRVPPGYAAASGRTPSPLALGPPEFEPPRLGAGGFAEPVQPYPPDLQAPPLAAPEASYHPARFPAMPDLPPTTDFTVDLASDAAGRSGRGFGRSSGPPAWLAVGGILVALGGGAAFGARLTAPALGSMLSTVTDLEQKMARFNASDRARVVLLHADDTAPLPPPSEPPTVGDAPPSADRAVDRALPDDAVGAAEASRSPGDLSDGRSSPPGGKRAHPGASAKKGPHAAPRAPKAR